MKSRRISPYAGIPKEELGAIQVYVDREVLREMRFRFAHHGDIADALAHAFSLIVKDLDKLNPQEHGIQFNEFTNAAKRLFVARPAADNSALSNDGRGTETPGQPVQGSPFESSCAALDG